MDNMVDSQQPIERYMKAISDNLVGKTSHERSRPQTQEPNYMAEVMVLLACDGVKEATLLHYKALDLFRDEKHAKQYVLMKSSKGLIGWINWTWSQGMKLLQGWSLALTCMF